MDLGAETQAIARERASHNCVWHLVTAVSRSDGEVSRSLVHFGFGVFYPQILEMRRLAKRKMSAAQRRAGIDIMRPKLVPMFPRYLFVRFDRGEDSWHRAFAIAGVGGVLCAGGLPVPVSERLIERLKGLESYRGIRAQGERLRVVFAIGQEVRINSGPFAAHHARMQTALDLPFDEVPSDLRVKVALSLFGRESLVELDSWQVEAL